MATFSVTYTVNFIVEAQSEEQAVMEADTRLVQLYGADNAKHIWRNCEAEVSEMESENEN